MKKISLVSLIIPLVFLACSKNDIPEPVACFEMYKFEDNEYHLIEQGVTREDIYYKSCGEADFLAIFTGGSKDTYSDSLGIGKPIRQEDYFRAKYGSAGEYEVTIVATNVDDYGNMKQNVLTKMIPIVDPAE